MFLATNRNHSWGSSFLVVPAAVGWGPALAFSLFSGIGADRWILTRQGELECCLLGSLYRGGLFKWANRCPVGGGAASAGGSATLRSVLSPAYWASLIIGRCWRSLDTCCYMLPAKEAKPSTSWGEGLLQSRQESQPLTNWIISKLVYLPCGRLHRSVFTSCFCRLKPQLSCRYKLWRKKFHVRSTVEFAQSYSRGLEIAIWNIPSLGVLWNRAPRFKNRDTNHTTHDSGC